MDSPVVTARYFYRGARATRGHRYSVSTYLVERLAGSTVVARIVPLGLVPRARPEHELVARGRSRNLEVAGSWHFTPSRHHARVRVMSAREAHQSHEL